METSQDNKVNENAKNISPKDRRLSKKQMWIFAIGQLGWSILGGIINAWLVSFYILTDNTITPLIPQGLAIGGFLTVIGLITALCRVWDAVSDPLVANLSDNSRNPKGRRIPFMRIAAVPFAIITVLVFMANEKFGQGGNIAWVSIMLVLFYTFMTIYCTPYNALISEFGKTQEDRMNISTFISLTYFGGTLLAYTPFLFAGFLKGAVGYYWSYRICFIVLAVIAAVCMLIPTIFLKETDFVDPKPSGTNAFKSLKSSFKNNDFKVFTGSDIMYWIGLTMFQTGLPFFVKTSMKLPEMWVMILMGAMTVLSACFYPLVNNLVKKFGKKKLVIAGFLGLAVAYFIVAFSGYSNNGEVSAMSYVFGILICVIAAFPMALLGVIPQSIVADIAEADSIKTGEKREGMFFAARTFAMKLGQSLAMILFTSLAVGFKDSSSSSSEIGPNKTGLMIVSFVACAFCILGAVILFFYHEKNIMNAILKEGDAQYANAIKNEKD